MSKCVKGNCDDGLSNRIFLKRIRPPASAKRVFTRRKRASSALFRMCVARHSTSSGRAANFAAAVGGIVSLGGRHVEARSSEVDILSRLVAFKVRRDDEIVFESRRWCGVE